MITVRLDKNKPESFALYPLFERRVVAFAERYLHVPVDQLRDLTLKRWINTPLAAGYWLGIDGHSAVAHLLSYIAHDDFNRPHIEFYQLESDAGTSLLPVMATVGDQIAAWVRAINLLPNITAPVTDGYLSTWHQHGAYRELLTRAGLHFETERVVMRCRLTGEERNGRSDTIQ